MSGDVQPRKRRDKKKKKAEDGPEEIIFPQQHIPTASTPVVIEELNIHIHKDPSTGGGFCAKFIFFILLAVLASALGLIITEHRGNTDVDSTKIDSHFAQLFEGWIDKSPDNHDHISEEEPSIEHSEEEHNDDDHPDHDSEVDEKEEVEDHDSDDEELSEEQSDESEEVDESRTQEDTIEDESEDISKNIDTDEQDESSDNIEIEYISVEEEEEEKYEVSQDDNDDDKLSASVSEVTQEDENDNDEDQETPDESTENVSEDNVDLMDSEEGADQTESEESRMPIKEERIVKLQKVETVPVKKGKRFVNIREQKKVDEEESVETADTLQENDKYNMVVKFGVGTALLVVAYVVLIQKWRRTEKIETKGDGSNEAVELTRRNTIVTPPNLKTVEQDIENVQQEYSEDDEDYDSEEDIQIKKQYQDLQSTYSDTLSPDWEPKEVRESRKNDYASEEGDDDEDYEDDIISENEDEELLKRLEAKYGRIQQGIEEPDYYDDDEEEEEEEDEEEFSSWKRISVPSDDVREDSDSDNEKSWPGQRSGAQTIYDFMNITNPNDWEIREELDRARQNLANDAAYALTLFNKILEAHPLSPRALYGKAQSLDILAERKKSNELLQQTIATYQRVLTAKEVPDALFQLAAERCIDRLRFRGHYSKAVPMHTLLISKFPDIPNFRNNLVVTYLTMNKVKEAQEVLQETLLRWPDDGLALVHYGFILKTIDNNLVPAVEFLRKGIQTKAPGVIDGRFYFHLGDALTRLGRKHEAMAVYADGVENKVFLSKYQRSLYNINRLKGQPWWKKEETPYKIYFTQLENNWALIREEGLSVLNQQGNFRPEAENLRDVGDWQQFELYARGVKNEKNCKKCPITCKLVETSPAAVGCKRGQIKFSVMQPGTHVWPHCGPTNCRLRAHLGLQVPVFTYIRVGEEIRSWKDGKLLIFDDSFEHEVWHNGTSTRLVLIVDVWHPELTAYEKKSLSSI